MTKLKSVYFQFAALFAFLLNAIMLVCANTNSCLMVYQPKAPKALERYSKIN